MALISPINMPRLVRILPRSMGTGMSATWAISRGVISKLNKAPDMNKQNGKQCSEIQGCFAKGNRSDYSAIGVDSFAPMNAFFTDWDHVMLYRNGILVWGAKP